MYAIACYARSVLVWLFILASVLVIAMVMFGTMHELVMPLSCPSCHHDGGEAIAGQHLHWYRELDRGGRVRCTQCGVVFKEHPNGSLVREGN
jgi:hypothetical protein